MNGQLSGGPVEGSQVVLERIQVSVMAGSATRINHDSFVDNHPENNNKVYYQNLNEKKIATFYI